MLALTSRPADLAVKAARAAFEEGPWSKFNGSQRRDLMLKLADLIEKNADELALVESRDNGAAACKHTRVTLSRQALCNCQGCGRRQNI